MRNVKPVRDWPLVPEKTAVVVVDVQKSEATAEIFARYPEYQQKLNDQMLPQLNKLLTGARESGCEVIYTVIQALTEDGRDVGLDHKLSGIFVAKSDSGGQVLDDVAPQGDEIILPKTSSGVFNSTVLAYVLRNMGIQNLIVAGLLTDQCVDMTVRDGADLGFYMICAEDACVARTQSAHQQAINAFGGYCRVQTVSDILTDIRQSAPKG